MIGSVVVGVGVDVGVGVGVGVGVAMGVGVGVGVAAGVGVGVGVAVGVAAGVGVGVGVAVGAAVGVGVGVAVGGVMITLVDRMRSMSRSPAFQGWLATLHVSAPPPPCVASSNESVVVTEPSRAMKSMACPASDAEGFSSSVTVPLSHFRLVIVALAPPTVKAAGFSTPLVPSAPTAAPMATGSKNASCIAPAGAVTVRLTTSYLRESSGTPLLHTSPPYHSMLG